MVPVLRAEDLYHTGVVVPDIAAAMDRMTAITGYRWTRVQSVERPIRLTTGDQVLRLQYAYTLDTPHIEMVQEVPGTPWTAAPHVATHHLGYWCDDLTTTSEELEEAGFAREAVGLADGRPAVFAYHLGPSGERIEIVQRIPHFSARLRERAAS